MVALQRARIAAMRASRVSLRDAEAPLVMLESALSHLDEKERNLRAAHQTKIAKTKKPKE